MIGIWDLYRFIDFILEPPGMLSHENEVHAGWRNLSAPQLKKTHANRHNKEKKCAAKTAPFHFLEALFFFYLHMLYMYMHMSK